MWTRIQIKILNLLDTLSFVLKSLTVSASLDDYTYSCRMI